MNFRLLFLTKLMLRFDPFWFSSNPQILFASHDYRLEKS